MTTAINWDPPVEYTDILAQRSIAERNLNDARANIDKLRETPKTTTLEQMEIANANLEYATEMLEQFTNQIMEQLDQ